MQREYKLITHFFLFRFELQDNFNVLHIAAMYSREDVVKLLLTKRGVDPFSTGGVSIFFYFLHLIVFLNKFLTTQRALLLKLNLVDL